MKEKEDLIEVLQNIFGHIPQETRLVLKMLGHPNVIGHTKSYINKIDTSSRCTNYEPPWSCAREAEAKYENIKYGWLGAGAGVGFEDWWCDNCRKRVMDD